MIPHPRLNTSVGREYRYCDQKESNQGGILHEMSTESSIELDSDSAVAPSLGRTCWTEASGPVLEI